MVSDVACRLTAPAPAHGLGIGTPVQHHFGMLADILEHIHLALLAHRELGPNMFRTPNPAFPTVGGADLLSVVAQQLQQVRLAAVRTVYALRLAMAIALRKDSSQAVLRFHAPDLVCDDSRGLVPADAHEL